MKVFLYLLYLPFLQIQTPADSSFLPAGFVYVQEAIPEIICDIRYASDNNFVGQRIDSYEKPKAILSQQAVKALKKAVARLDKKGYKVKVFDAYRPQSAVQHFVRWAQNQNDTLRKADYYPKIDKKDLFQLGYIAAQSGHSRGSTVDLTLLDKHTGMEIDMGSSFDLFDSVSNHGTKRITPAQQKNRDVLKKVMLRYGFKILPEEWWHFTLRQEPFPNTYFDFKVQ